MSQQYQAPPKNEMDHPRLGLKGVKHSSGKTVPNLKPALLGNLLRLRIYTGVEGEKTISAKFDPREIIAIMRTIRDKVIPNREDHTLKFEKTSLWIGGQKRDTPGVEATIVVGRHKGNAFISMYGYNTSKIIFPFNYADAMAMYDESGEKLSIIDESNLAAFAWADSIMRVYYPAMVKNYVHPDSNFDNKGGNKGGGNSGGWKGGNKGGGNSGWGGGQDKSSSFDDDISF